MCSSVVPAVGLESSRLYLRPWRDTDLEAFAAMNADPEVMEFFPSVLSRAESDAFAVRIRELMAAQGWGFFALERKADGAFLGFTGLHRPEGLPFSPCTEVGWRLARPFWGQGYATEAASACLDFAFAKLGEARIHSFTAVSNVRSQAVMRRLGMRQQGYFEHPRVAVGHPLRPHVLYALEGESWSAARGWDALS